ncbi:MAG: cadherin-like domain-containing protein, partial [Pseudomonadota bacterium]
MKPMKTPGVYIVEKNAFPNSVVQVATAVPAFIGYTEKAMIGNTSVAGKPTRISSMSEFHANFGFGPKPIFSLKEATAPGEPLFSGSSATKTDPLPPATFSVMKRGKAKSYELTQESPAYALYGAMRLFFQNGGGACYIVSVGSYEDDIDADALMGGIAPLVKEAEPTLLVIPETTRLSRQNSQKVQQAMLMHCGEQMKNRFAVLDMFGGHLERQMPINDPVAAFRDDIGVNHLDFGAVYYPWVNTSIFDTRNFSFENIDPNARDLFMELLKGSANPERLPDEKVAPQLKEIARTDGVPKITGSAAVVTTKGARTVLTEKILKAEGYGLDDESLVFTLAMPGAADDAPAPTAAGRFALSPDEETAIASFTQAQLMAGEVVHIQDGDETEATLSVTVQQMNGDQPVGKPSAVTSLKVSVVLAEGDLAVLDGSSVEIDVLANDDGGADATSVKLVEADDDTGKTKTVDKVGIWTVDATTGKVTFAAAEGFAGPMAEVKYTVTVGGTESKPQE